MKGNKVKRMKKCRNSMEYKGGSDRSSPVEPNNLLVQLNYESKSKYDKS